MKKILFFIIAMTVGFHPIGAQGLKLRITVGEKVFIASLNDNETTKAFASLLPLTVNMTEMGGYEKYYYLPGRMPGTAINPVTIYEGDLMIWSSDCLVLFYTTRSTSYSYIRLGRIDNVSGLKEALGSGSVRIKYELEGGTTGIEETNAYTNLYEVTPIPAADYLEVSGEFEKLSLYNTNSSLVAESTTTGIHTNNLPSGIYFLKIDSGKNGVHTKKIIKK